MVTKFSQKRITIKIMETKYIYKPKIKAKLLTFLKNYWLDFLDYLIGGLFDKLLNNIIPSEKKTPK